MKTTNLFLFCIAIFLLGSCSGEKKHNTTPLNPVNEQIQKLSAILTAAEKNDDIKSFLAHYDENAISMPEYQPALTGVDEVEAFYKEIFQRQAIKVFERKVDEIINLDNTILEIGTFKKEYTDASSDTLLTQNGKYWNIWQVQPDGRFKLKGEAFGFFHPVKNPGALVVQLPKTQPAKSEIASDKKISFELKAYNALNEKLVKIRDGAQRSEFYTDDAKFMPFAEPTVTGINEIKPYLIEYSTRGDVNIDSLAVYTYHYENLDDYILEYSKFKVKWSVPQLSGRTEGKGIRLWKRQEDKSLKIFRHIGTHNHIE